MNTKRALRYLFLCLALLTCFGLSVSAVGDMPDAENYTYTSDGVPVYAPPSYLIERTVYPKEICPDGVGKLADIAVAPSGEVFLLDSERNRIIQLDAEYRAVKVIDSFMCNGKAMSFAEPSGISADNGILCISDTGNGRVVHYDTATGSGRIISAPSGDNALVDYKYRPTHAVLDKTGRTLVIAENQTQGLMIFNKEGEFTGYLGATQVSVDLGEMFWRAFASKEQRKRMKKFVPTEYNNLSLDSAGFIFATALSDSKVSRLNLGGSNVLRKNEFYDPYGDIDVKTSSLKYSASSSIVDVAAKGNIYSILDRNNCRVFTYDYSGNLLYIFGSKGTGSGMLGTPVALDYQGLKILVVDQGDNSLKIYSPEKYAVNILEALDCHDSGDYGKELPIWKSVLSENNNYELAYLYIGKIAYMKGNYREAMKNFEIAQNKEGYSKALRKQQFETAGSLLVPFCIAIIVLILITVIIKRVNRKYPSVFLPLRHVRQKIRQSRAAHEVGYALYVLRHPFDGFWYIKTEKRCGAFTATGCLLFAVAANIAEMAGTPFLFTNTNDKNLLVSGFLSIACLPLIWCVSNWAFTTLTDGKGSFRDIYVYTMISILPRAFSQIVALTVSQFLTLDSATVLSVIHAAGILWMCFLLFAGTLTVHQYSPTKTVLSVLLIILGILVILFMILLSVSLVDKMLHFGTEYVREFSLRM